MSWLIYSLVIPISLIVALHVLSHMLPGRLSEFSAFWARALTSIIALSICATYGSIASAVLRLVGYGGLSQWTTARAFKWTMWWGTGVTFRILDSGRTEAGRRGGEEALLERPAVFVGNHQSELDILLLGCMFPQYCSVTAKKSLKYTPFLGWFMALSKTVFIDRADRKTARAAMSGAAMQMQKEKHSVFIFPEGTRSYAEKPELLPFKKGAFHLAIQAQVPIVPVVAANYSHVLNMKKWIFRSGEIDFSVLPPIQTKGMTAADVDALCVRVREAMQEELIRLSHVTDTGNGAAPAHLPRGSFEGANDGDLRRRAVKNEL
ncbi:1-acylglycerol-3-phosphate O [Delitschia confertaspora ATCC 74209]|uniref:1-acyl-sn-glycerol-3-phosphate acyltransferase n=1 Tax=Delitschia confertaspora ATCC 74209 TaxID=1513339 RepID=A0A9P4MTQ6_9PLEO|nr:1-acylglycerol-3-phosphate O [Delitschia confertaspora ATCC 74209]